MRGLLLLALLVFCGGCAVGGTPQPPQPRALKIDSDEIQSSSAKDLYALITVQRPDWLTVMVDSADLNDPDRITVYLNGALLGNLQALMGLPLDGVRSVDFTSAHRWELHGDHPPSASATALILIKTSFSLREWLLVERDGWSVAIFPWGAAVGQPARTMESALSRAGHGEIQSRGSVGSVLLGVHYPVKNSLAVELLLGESHNGLSHATSSGGGGWNKRVNIRHDARVAIGLLSYKLKPLGIGVGPALSLTDWKWSAHDPCECLHVQKESTSQFGLAADLSLRVPGRSRVYADIRTQALYFQPAELQDYPVEYREMPATSAGGVTYALRFGLGIRLGGFLR